MRSNTKTFYEQEIDRLAGIRPLSEYQYIRVRQSKRFMEHYYSEKITIKELASSAYMSEFHYIRMFRQVYGLSPRKFLRDIRINKARELLKRGMNTTHVCTIVGYDSLPTFSNAFKRGTGYSPTAYLQLHNSNPE